MTNHVHLLIQVGTVPLGKMMHELQFRYAQYFNLRYEMDGHLFQDRYYDVICTNDAQLLNVLRYIHRNPVKHGLVSDPGEWPWSSHAAYLGEPSPLVETSFCLSFFGKSRDAVEAYRAFVGAKAPAGWPHESRAPGFETSEPAKVDARLAPSGLNALILSSVSAAGLKLTDLIGPSKSKQLAMVRKNLALDAWLLGYSTAEIARALKRSKSAVGEQIVAARRLRIRTESGRGD